MKTKNSIRNAVSSIIVNITNIIVGLIAQALFLKILGAEYLGINGLFSNIISILGIVELGIGNAIIYNLYKPLVNKDYNTIKSLMKFYEKAYHIIAIVVLLLGLCIMPFLPLIVKEVTLNININIIYILFILDIVCSYLLSYKRSILYADQKNFIINIIHVSYYILLNFLQLLFLFMTKNYYVYLIIKILMRIFENIIITIFVNKKYSFLLSKKTNPLDKKIENDIIKKVKALFFHKIGGFIVSGTDNIIISRYLGLVFVGLYSNYFMIIDAVNKLFGQAISAVTPSIGHMLINDNKKKQFEVFKKIRFLNFWIATFAGTSILVIVQSFIKIWIGKEYLLTTATIFVLVFNFFQKMMRNSYSSFKEAAGIFYEDRYVPLVESTLNIVFSILLVKMIGMPGVFLGTIISGLSLWCYSYPKYVYKKLFDRSYICYAKETIGYILLFICIASFTFIISRRIVFNNNYIQFLANGLISLVIPNSILLLIFAKNDNFKYYKNLILKFLKKFHLSK